MSAATTLLSLVGLLVFLLTVGTLLVGLLNDLKTVVIDIADYGTSMIKYIKGELPKEEVEKLRTRIDNELQRINETFTTILFEIFNKTSTFLETSNSSFINVTHSIVEIAGRDHG